MNVRAIFYYSTIFPKDCQAAIAERKEKRAAPAILMRLSYFHLFPPRQAFGKEVLIVGKGYFIERALTRRS